MGVNGNANSSDVLLQVGGTRPASTSGQWITPLIEYKHTYCYLYEFCPEVDGVEPVCEVWVRVQHQRSLTLWNTLLPLQLFTDVLHQLHL